MWHLGCANAQNPAEVNSVGCESCSTHPKNVGDVLASLRLTQRILFELHLNNEELKERVADLEKTRPVKSLGTTRRHGQADSGQKAPLGVGGETPQDGARPHNKKRAKKQRRSSESGELSAKASAGTNRSGSSSNTLLPNSGESVQATAVHAGCKRSSTTADLSGSGNSMLTDAGEEETAVPVAAVETATAVTTSDGADDGFTKVIRKRNKERRLQKGKSADRDQLLICSSNAVSTERALCVEGVDRRTSAFDLRGWLSRRGAETRAVFKLETKKRCAVFCVVPSRGDFSKCSKAEFWPEGVQFRRWVGTLPYENMVKESVAAPNGPSALK